MMGRSPFCDPHWHWLLIHPSVRPSITVTHHRACLPACAAGGAGARAHTEDSHTNHQQQNNNTRQRYDATRWRPGYHLSCVKSHARGAATVTPCGRQQHTHAQKTTNRLRQSFTAPTDRQKNKTDGFKLYNNGRQHNKKKRATITPPECDVPSRMRIMLL